MDYSRIHEANLSSWERAGCVVAMVLVLDKGDDLK